MVLADLLLVNKYKFAIAHINHQTRGQDSEEDQLFVEAFCIKNNILCHSISKPISAMAIEAKENFHAYARKFRYDYLHDILMSITTIT